MKLVPPDPPIGDELIRLRALRPDDAAAVAAACNEGEIVRWMTLPLDYSEEMASEWIASTQEGWGKGTADFAVVERASSMYVGAIGLVVREPWLGEIGYLTAAAFRGLGYATRALILVTAWGFSLGLTRLQLTIRVGNTASEHVAAKAGFRLEGTLRAYANQRGELRDVTMWARLATDPRE